MQVEIKHHVCLVTDEVMPFTKGGIGAFVRNMIDAHSDQFAISILFSGVTPPDQQLWTDRYPNVALYNVNDLQSDSEALGWEQQFLAHGFLSKSLRIYQALVQLESDGLQFDVVEFLDWGSPAYYPIQFKRCGIWQTTAVLAVRIHCTESVLRSFEYRSSSSSHSTIYDVERKSLADADIVVSSLSPVAKYYADFYGFAESWCENVRIEAPQVWIEEHADAAIKPHPYTPIVFSSKLQEIKRPELFAKGATLFVSKESSYRGTVTFAAFKASEHGLDDSLSKLPHQLRSRFEMKGSLGEQERRRLIANGVVVFPNAFEAFCFAAYEASLSGALVVLNAMNPAFGEHSPWIDGVNCYKFDGTAGGLSATLADVFANSAQPLSPVSVATPALPYWQSEVSSMRSKQKPGSGPAGSLTVFVLHRDQSDALESTLSILQLECIEIQIVILDDASSDPDSVVVLDQLSQGEQRNVSVYRSRVPIGWGAQLNQAVRQCSTEFACVIPSGTIITIGALGAFVEALSRQTEFDVLLPTSALLHELDDKQPSYVFHPLGEALASGELHNAYASHLFIVRSSVTKSHHFSESIKSNFEWEYLRRLALVGHRMLVWPIVDVHYIDRNVLPYETHLDAEFSFNRDIVSKAQISGRNYGLRVDVSPSPLAESLSLSIQPPPPQITNSPSLPTGSSEIELLGSSSSGSVLVNDFIDQPRKPAGFLYRLRDIVMVRRARYLSHIDILGPALEKGAETIVERGNTLSVEGWAFGGTPDRLFLAELFLEGNGSSRIPKTSYRHPRADVATQFSLRPNSMVGFSFQIETSDLAPGSYQLVIKFSRPRKSHKRHALRRITLV